MNYTSIGDGAQYLTQSRQNTLLKTRLNTLAAQLSSGEIKDKSKALGGDTSRLSAIEHSLKTLTAKMTRNSETALSLSTMQRVLDNVNTQRGTLSETLVTITQDTPKVQIDDAAKNANGRFSAMVNAFNTEVGGRRLFAGAAVDQPALAPAEDMLADIMSTLGGATDSLTILAAVDVWFDDPAGGFATMGYLGDTGPQTIRRLDENTVITIEARADNPALKDVLKAAAIAALADEIPGIGQQTKSALLREGGLRLQTSAVDIVSVQAQLGFAQSEVEIMSTTLSAEQSALSTARNNLVQDDPYETASALQAVQLQLEMHYQMTARLSRLSLAEYLR